MDTTIKKEGISLIELLSASVIIVAAVLGFWKNTDVRLSRLELISEQQNKDREVINAKLDKLQESVNTINLSLINKQDRK
jgi:Tfp pilus assembly protein PilV